MIIDYLYLFCIYSFLGWVVEVVFFYFKTKKFNRRGILGGPYCPLYGLSLTVCTAILQHTSNIIIEIIICGAVCTLFEFITALLFDKVLKTPMWDYSECRFNIKGYVCLEFSIIWSFAAFACIKILNNLLFAMPTYVTLFASVAILAMMMTDVIFKAKTISR